MRMSGWRGISLVLTGIQLVDVIGGGYSGYRKKRMNPGCVLAIELVLLAHRLGLGVGQRQKNPRMIESVRSPMYTMYVLHHWKHPQRC